MITSVHAVELQSRSNGPGLRAVVWLQGCTIGCPGCFNPGTHPASGGRAVETVDLARDLVEAPGIGGISISGGEPFQQAAALLDLVERVRAAAGNLSILVFTGYTRRAVEAMPMGRCVLKNIDVLVAGAYVAGLHSGVGLIGSRNQEIHLLTGRHSMAEFAGVARMEAIIRRDGTVTLTGIGRSSGLELALGE